MKEINMDTVDMRSIDIYCDKCVSEAGKIINSGPHRKLVCGDCGKYVKMLSKSEHELLIKTLKPDISEKTVEEKLDELNFKLDIIIEYIEELKNG